MGNRRYPPLKHYELVAIFEALGFRKVRTGDHPCYERTADAIRSRKVVPIDDYDEFEKRLIKSMISQSGFTREEFYGATKNTGKKIGIYKIFTPCAECGMRLGDTDTCPPCLAFKKAVAANV